MKGADLFSLIEASELTGGRGRRTLDSSGRLHCGPGRRSREPALRLVVCRHRAHRPRRPFQTSRAQPPGGPGRARLRCDHHREGAPSTSLTDEAVTSPRALPFLLTHGPPDEHVGPGTDGTDVTDGIESALAQAHAVVGARNIAIGAAAVAQQYLMAGLLDEIHLNVGPVLLGGGIRLFDNLEDGQFDLECKRVVESDGVTHLRYSVVR
ncbi:MAG: dihydrofolate reductase family protein [Acidimicrobiales bacterium]